MKSILVTGAEGQLGWELKFLLQKLGHTVFSYNHQDFDLTNPAQMKEKIEFCDPAIIVNAAAYTAVDRAESEPELAMQINGIAPGFLAEEAKRLNALLMHFSTDYVFDGRRKGPYFEENLTSPINVYGETKLAGEKNIQAVGCRHLIFRSSWIYSARGHNFLKTMLKLAHENKPINVVSDQIGAPTWSYLLAKCSVRAMLAMENNADLENAYGLYHLTASGSTSWHGFAEEIFEYEQIEPDLKAITSQQYVCAAKRPLNSLLSNDKFIQTFGLEMQPWEIALKLCLDTINNRPLPE